MAIKYALYARKSTEQEDRQAASIPDQAAWGQALAEREGLSLAGVWAEARSAKAPGRPVFSEVMGLVEAGEIAGLLAWKLDRLCRNPIDAGALSWALQRGQLREIRTSDRAYLPQDNVLILGLEFSASTQYLRDLSANVRRGIESAARAGYWQTSRVPYGYRAVPTGEGRKRRLELDPDRAKAILRLYELLDAGHTLREARAALLPDYPDLPSPTHLATLVHNLHYTGVRAYLRQTRPGVGAKVFRPPPDQWRLFPATHPAIIAPDLFQRVQQRLAERDPGTAGAVRTQGPLTGLLFCGRCGKSLSGGDSRYYICYRRRHYQDCSLPAIHRHRLLRGLLDALDGDLFSVEVLEDVVESARQELLQARQGHDRAKLARELADLERRQERLLEALERGSIAAEQIERRLRQVQGEIDRVRLLVAGADRIEAIPEVTLEQVQAMAGRLVEEMASTSAPIAREALRAVVHRVVVEYPRATATVELAGQERQISWWIVEPPEIPADLDALPHRTLAALVRRVRRFSQDATFHSAEVNAWPRARCIAYLRGRGSK